MKISTKSITNMGVTVDKFKIFIFVLLLINGYALYQQIQFGNIIASAFGVLGVYCCASILLEEI